MNAQWVEPDIKQNVIHNVNGLHQKSDLRLGQLLGWLNLPSSTYYHWLQDHTDRRSARVVPKSHWLLDQERRAILAYAKDHPFENHRQLTYRMIDENVVAVSPSTTYRVLKRAGHFNRWIVTPSSHKKGFDQPTHVHEHWHIDIKHVRIDLCYFYLISILDGYSRYIVHFELRERMTALDVEITIARALDKFPNTGPRLITDNGAPFIARDFHDYLRWVKLDQVRTRVHHPQSNGKLERWHRSLEEECLRQKALLGLDDARRIIGDYVTYYNTQRLHSALFYLTPEDFLVGRVESRLNERNDKLCKAKEHRKMNRFYTLTN